MTHHIGLLVAILAFGIVPSASSQDRGASGTVIPIWPEGVPGAIAGAAAEASPRDGWITNVQVPTLTPYPAPATHNTGTAIVVWPGGGYAGLAIDKEGTAVARWLNTLGVSAFVLKYRLKEYGHPAPLRDVLRAIRIVRSGAAKWSIDPSRIGVLGFSAGGHLASTAGTLYGAPEGRTGAPLDAVSARPDFMVLVYPVISMKPPLAHAGSRENLIGKNPSPDLEIHLSTELQVTPDTPPAFLVHGGTDQTVAPENSLMFYEALRRARVPGELHLYEKGPHGVGLNAGYGPISDWPARCADWMEARGLLGAGRTEK